METSSGEQQTGAVEQTSQVSEGSAGGGSAAGTWRGRLGQASEAARPESFSSYTDNASSRHCVALSLAPAVRLTDKKGPIMNVLKKGSS